MALPFGTRYVTLVWGVLECLFFSGLLNGWIWVQQILKEDGYFLNYCNGTSNFQGSALKDVYYSEHGDNNPVVVHENGKRFKCFYKKVLKEIPINELSLITSTPAEHFDGIDTVMIRPNANTNLTDLLCNEQDDQLELVISLVVILRNMLMLPLGIFMDKYGTSRTRLVAITCSAFGSLTMLFSGEAFPWLVSPALLMLGMSGLLLMLTDLQIANMFGSRRYTVMSTFVGSYFSGGIVMYFMKLTKYTGVNIQTSFMFITIGIVPVLISTIAMLPRSRIPWPLPASYGKGKQADDYAGKSKPWQRRISVGGKKRPDTLGFMHVVKNPIYISMVVWFSILSLKSFVFDLNIDIHIRNMDSSRVKDHMTLYAMILLLSLPLSPLIGIIMDWQQSFVQDPHVQQMRNILYAICLNYVLSLCSSVTSLVPDINTQVTSFVLVMLEKVTLHASMFAFLTHVHFPGEHFGKCVGIAFTCAGFLLTLQYPLKLLIYNTFSNSTFYVQLILLVLLLIAACHPIVVWYQCKTGKIKDLTNSLEPKKSLTIMLMEKTIDETSVDKSVDGACKDDSNSSKTGLQVTDL